jgi:hypothetical protein
MLVQEIAIETNKKEFQQERMSRRKVQPYAIRFEQVEPVDYRVGYRPARLDLGPCPQQDDISFAINERGFTDVAEV